MVSDLYLALDVGNTEIDVGLGHRGSWLSRWRLAADAQRTSDEYGIVLDELFCLSGRRPGDVTRVVLSSVVPCLTPSLAESCASLTGRPPLIVGPGVRTGMKVRYNPPAALGSDRLADAVAARHRFGSPVVAVDFGTATTFNVVGPDGSFRGGAIAPGLAVAAESLARSGARLSRVDLPEARSVPIVGRTTEQSMQSGVLYGFAGLVAGVLARFDVELAEMGAAERVPVVATGGNAGRIAPLVARIDHLVPDLTLDGLYLILEANTTEAIP